jgi:hypothetical protein
VAVSAKIGVTLSILLFSVASYAGPVLFTCERPAWAGKKGCGDSNAYETYTFYTYAEAILEDQSADKDAKGYLRPEHVFMKVETCDRAEGRPIRGRFEVRGELMTLWLGDVRTGDGLMAEKVVLDMDSLTAELSDAEHSSVLSCSLQIGATTSDLQAYDDLYDARFKLPRNPWSYDPQRYPPE